ncbi:MAG: hypothetical protein ACQETE_02575 [Bacteroidota bacterium]
MSVTEEQFKTWAKQGAVAGSKATADSIKNAVNSYDGFPDVVTNDVFIQGSYKNSTNIYSESDVDIVAELTSSFVNNLNPSQKDQLGIYSVDYGLSDFRRDVIDCLADYYGLEKLNPDNKVVKLAPSSNRRPADILICTSYREYYKVEKDAYYKGVYFRTTQANKNCYSFPKRHYQNAVDKNQACDGNFKPMVRIFKNLNRILIDQGDIGKKTAPSYFIECFLSNVPDNNYSGSYSDQFINILEYLVNGSSWDDFKCLNGLRSIWGDKKEQWNQDDALNFLRKIVNYCQD